MPRSRIDNWVPTRWDQIVGNERIVEHFQDALRYMRTGIGSGPNTMVTGVSRSGKTAAVKLFAQSALCDGFDTATLNPCGLCSQCKSDAARFGHEGLFTFLSHSCHYVPVDCANVSADELCNLMLRLRDYNGIRIVYLDEVHRLHRPNSPLEERLLKPLEETNFTWIASSAITTSLEKMFLKRFTIIETQLPTRERFVHWLADRCEEWGIAWDEPETLLLLADRAKLVPGDALKVLARASMTTTMRLTHKIVSEHCFIH